MLQLEDMFQTIGTPQGIEHVMFQFKDMPQGFKKYWVKYKTWMINFGHNPIKETTLKLVGSVPIKEHVSSKSVSMTQNS